MGRKKVTQEHTNRRRAEIMQAATDVFARKGYLASGIADIAKKLDVGHGTIYRYFSNKLDIFLCILKDTIAEMLVIADQYVQKEAHSVAEYELQIQQQGVEFMMLFLKNPQRMRFIFEEMHSDLKVRELIAKSFVEFQEKTVLFFQKGVKIKAIRPDLDLPTAARLTNAMVFETMRSIILGSNSDANNLKIIETIQKILLHGIGNPVKKN